MSCIKSLALLLALGLVGCVEAPSRPVEPPPHAFRYSIAPPAPYPDSAPRTRQRRRMLAEGWQQLPDWGNGNLQPSWLAFRHSCQTLRHRAGWKRACKQAEHLHHPDNEEIRAFFEQEFEPHRLSNRDGSTQGVITGYYEPKLRGSYQRTSRFRFPLYANPGQSGDPAFRRASFSSRRDIESGRVSLNGLELLWVDNEMDLFFLQVQGSGRIELPNGQLVRVGHDGNNGRPYRSIGQKLVNMGELPLKQASLWDIKDWGLRNPDAMSQLMQHNPRYVYFRALPADAKAPVGALGVPLTEGYSLAVDPAVVPLGAPVFVSTTYPNSPKALNRLMVAQDTGFAIRGPVRADFFWGYGPQAEAQAARMKQAGQMWVLLPRPEAVTTVKAHTPDWLNGL